MLGNAIDFFGNSKQSIECQHFIFSQCSKFSAQALAKQAAAVASTSLRADPWLLLVAPDADVVGNRDSAAPSINNRWTVLDAGKRGATVNSDAESLTCLFGSAAAALMTRAMESKGLGSYRDAYLLGYGGEGQNDIVGAWAGVARTVVQAFQRRGESEDVARWLPLQLALDPSAEEWGYMLRQQGSGNGIRKTA